MTISTVPEWMENLEEEDVVFIKKFVLSSGSLKKIAESYGVTYPTVRLRLDKLIEKIEAQEQEETAEKEDPVICPIRKRTKMV